MPAGRNISGSGRSEQKDRNRYTEGERIGWLTDRAENSQAV